MTSHLAITMGDPAGIGPEIIVKACRALAARLGAGALRLLIIGHASALEQARIAFASELSIPTVKTDGDWPALGFLPAGEELAPITQPSMMVAPIPTSTLSPMVQPCSVTWWVMEQSRPTKVPVPLPTWTIAKSWMFVRSPITTAYISARMTALGQMEASAARVTFP